MIFCKFHPFIQELHVFLKIWILQHYVNMSQAVSSIIGATQTRWLHVEKSFSFIFIILHKTSTYKWIKLFNIKSDTLNLIQHKIRKKYIELAVTGRDFLYNMNSTGTKNNNTLWDIMKLKSFYLREDTIILKNQNTT